jgi:hypothetical protein
MSRFLCVDIGAGTMDVLWFDTEAVHHYKAVVVSRCGRLPCGPPACRGTSSSPGARWAAAR